jgi:Holliday junction resolvase RusA-like endonuclease
MAYDKRQNYLYIGQQLPSLNEYVAKNRTNPNVGATFKRSVEDTIQMWIAACVGSGNLHRIESQCEIVIDFYERTKRRDVDNVQSATKFILDALVKAGILPNDNQRWVRQVYHRVLPSVGIDCVYVYLIENRKINLEVADE